MPLNEPSWWYGPPHSIAARLLTPAARLWEHRARRRMAAANPYRPACPVICIGNFTAGGTGKTPLAAMIAGELARRGRTPVILSRGHGGRIAGPHWVDARADAASAVGDEPLLHAKRFPVMVARDRAAGARAIEARRSATDVIVMDDGLQNPSLAKDLSIAVVDGRRGIGNGEVIPAGPLRAGLELQLGLVDAIAINVPDNVDPAACPIIDMLRRRFHGPALTFVTRPAEPLAWLEGLPVIAWAGIGNPDRFFDLLTRSGAQVVERRAFGDHHIPKAHEAEHLLAAADRRGASLVTTEKDLARLAGGGPLLAALALASRAIPIVVEPVERDRGRLESLLAALLAEWPLAGAEGPAAPAPTTERRG